MYVDKGAVMENIIISIISIIISALAMFYAYKAYRLTKIQHKSTEFDKIKNKIMIVIDMLDAVIEDEDKKTINSRITLARSSINDFTVESIKVEILNQALDIATEAIQVKGQTFSIVDMPNIINKAKKVKSVIICALQEFQKKGFDHIRINSK